MKKTTNSYDIEVCGVSSREAPGELNGDLDIDDLWQQFRTNELQASALQRRLLEIHGVPAGGLRRVFGRSDEIMLYSAALAWLVLGGIALLAI